MDTNVQALKNLYVALGGDLSTVANLATSSEVINAIAGLSGLTGEHLPAVTAEDNGKVLKVVKGKWKLGTDLTE